MSMRCNDDVQRKLIIPLTGGIDSTTILYGVVHGIISPYLYGFQSQFDEIVITIGCFSHGYSGEKDEAWFNIYTSSEEFKRVSKILKVLYGTDNCEVTTIVTVSQWLEKDGKHHSTFQGCTMGYFLPVYMLDLMKLIDHGSVILLGLNKGELPHFKRDFWNKFMDDYLNSLYLQDVAPKVHERIINYQRETEFEAKCFLEFPLEKFDKHDVYAIYNAIVPKDAVLLNTSASGKRKDYKEKRYEYLKENIDSYPDRSSIMSSFDDNVFLINEVLSKLKKENVQEFQTAIVEDTLKEYFEKYANNEDVPIAGHIAEYLRHKYNKNEKE